MGVVNPADLEKAIAIASTKYGLEFIVENAYKIQHKAMQFHHLLGFAVLGVKFADFLIEDIVKIDGSLGSFFLNFATVVIKASSGFGFVTRYKFPAYFLGVSNNTALKGFVLPWFGHDSKF
ncbi:MAG: hypothetical protein HWQ38_33270 [Nostoc sp. NMS7]|uniref:hypothetical protein n=1 Tax=Nostoc sp. NMS7 TaxID=2815391 RepID=UPI0025D86B8D|nr:hypothetical protein [Nostoc sp. NMS7]MBN3951084.1 hypothetical protein [Nostoc sp. NMS7]